MRDQTCATLWGGAANTLRTGRAVVKGWSPLRKDLAAGIIAVLLAWGGIQFWQTSESVESEVSETVPVLVAGRYIPAFNPLKSGSFSVKNYPRNLVPPAALRSASELSNETGQPVYAAAVAIPEGQPITRSLLTELGKGHSLALLLQAGKVAVSFAVEKDRGAGGWIQPGDIIAIFQSAVAASAQRRQGTEVLFPAARVLAVDQNRLGAERSTGDSESLLKSPEIQDDTRSVITVLLNALQAEALIKAQEQGRLSVVLRASGDDAPWEPNGK